MRRKPITSADEYAILAVEHDDDFEWRNHVPVDPSIWHEILDRFPDLCDTVIDNEALPEDVLTRLARWPLGWIRFQVGWHQPVPQRAIDSMVRDIDPTVRRSVSFTPNLALADLSSLQMGYDKVPFAWAAKWLKERHGVHWRDVSKQPVPQRLAPYEDPSAFIEALAKFGLGHLNPLNPRANSDWLRAIIEPGDAGDWIAYGGYTAPDVFAGLLVGDKWEQRGVAAKSPHCPVQVLAALALDSDDQVRELVASNSAADIPTLILLASDDTGYIRDDARKHLRRRFGICLNERQVVALPVRQSFPRIRSRKEFVTAVRSPVPFEKCRVRFGEVTFAFSSRTRLPFRYRKHLLSNSTISVERLFQLLDVPSEGNANDASHVYWGISLLGREKLARVFSNHSSPRIRGAAASSRNVPSDLIDQLRGDPDGEVRWQANRTWHQSRGLPAPDDEEPWNQRRTRSAEQFVEYCRSEDPLDREKATTQKAAYPGLWREVLARAPELAKWVAITETVGPQLLDELADWPDSEVQKWVSDHPRVWLKTLNRLAFDADPAVRRRSVYNSRLSNQQLKKLRHDSDPEVAAEATRRLAARAYVERLLNDPEWWRHLGNSEIA